MSGQPLPELQTPPFDWEQPLILPFLGRLGSQMYAVM